MPNTANGITASRGGTSDAGAGPHTSRATPAATITAKAAMAQRRRRGRVRSSAVIHASPEVGRSSGRSASGATSAAASRAESSGRAARSARASVARSALKSVALPVSASNATAASEYKSARPSTRPPAICSGAM